MKIKPFPNIPLSEDNMITLRESHLIHALKVAINSRIKSQIRMFTVGALAGWLAANIGFWIFVLL